MTQGDGDIQSQDLRPYYELLKPRVMRLVVFTAFVGMVVAPVSVNPILGLVSLLFIALGAGASGALNMYIDSDIDAVMSRTQTRPIPLGQVAREHALSLGVFASVLSVAMLGLYANWVAAGLLAFTIFFYVVIYSIGLKRRTPQNIVIGGAAGAFPPVIGWVVATGSVSFEAVLLFLVIFLWTPPHFWALALFRNDDYAKANVPMMPVMYGEVRTRKEILVYSVLFLAVMIFTSLTSIGGFATFLVGLVGGGLMVLGAVRMLGRREDGGDGFRAEKRYFGLSIICLFAFFLALLVDDALGYFFPSLAQIFELI